MQGILRLMLVAVCYELSTARPRLKTVGRMTSEWPRSGLPQTGLLATLLQPKAGCPSPSNPLPPPCSLGLRCPEGMNPPLEASAPTTEARIFFTRSIKRFAKEKLWKAEQASWNMVTQGSHVRHHRHHRHLHQITRSRQVHQRFPNVPKTQNMLRKLRGGAFRTKRSATQDATVQYAGSREVKFRMEGPYALYLMPTPAGNSLRLSTQHANHACFRVHMFNSLADTGGGSVVMLEAHTGSYLQSNTSGFLSLVNSEAAAANVTQVDNKFFHLSSYTGDNTVKIKHINTDLHLQASENGVSLVTTDPLAADGMLFYEFSCSNT
ncbi:uncharacterized protein LOC123500052 [Portunus trituberculatus]|uniref:Uncharacterized protein n=1 Tax=Portunus trituberculatus TaxID=210409 RepID=A0A5B7EZ21_PORTR|nr:uncharacterized protein LOC123500052 [Portunus trituberculatus]MPC38113.1 hypothetical protein [Portunus trituberculatus]